MMMMTTTTTTTTTTASTRPASTSRASTSRSNLRAVRRHGSQGRVMMTTTTTTRARARAAAAAAAAARSEDEALTWEEIEAIVNRDLVRSVMTQRVLSVRPDASVFDAIKLLVDNRISAVPVVDESGQVLGVVSEYDLMARVGKKEKTKAVVDDGMFPRVGRCDEFNGNVQEMWSKFHDLQDRMHKVSGSKVLTAMHETKTVYPDMPLVEATEMMLNDKLARIPVVDQTGKLVGILSRGDIMRRTFQAFMLAQSATDSEAFAREVKKLDVSDPGIASELNNSPSLVEFCEASPDDDECRIYED